MTGAIFYALLWTLATSHALNGVRHLLATTDFNGRAAPRWFLLIAGAEIALAIVLCVLVASVRIETN